MSEVKENMCDIIQFWCNIGECTHFKGNSDICEDWDYDSGTQEPLCKSKTAQLEALKAYAKDKLGVELVEKKVCKWMKDFKGTSILECTKDFTYALPFSWTNCPHCGGEIVEV